MTITFDAYAVLRLLLGAVCLALLTSIGGAGIYAAPLTLPVLWFAAWTASRGGRIALNAVAALTAGEVAWAAGYAFGGPYEWMLPLAGIGAVAVLYPWTQRYARPLPSKEAT